MIVRDEARGIRETLASIKPYIGHWTVLDTGSTDGTQEMIRQELESIPGQLHEEPFVDFSTTRNRVLALHGEQTQFVIMLSGDDIVVNGGGLLNLRHEGDVSAFSVQRKTGSTSYLQVVIMATGQGWRYVGRTHEALVNPSRFATDAPLNVSIIRKNPENKYARWLADLVLLQRDIDDNPENPRPRFYLAQTYECLGRFEEALAAYETRIKMSGWIEEVYEALFRRARVMGLLGYVWPEVQQAYLDAHALDPRRAEPLFAIAEHWYFAKENALCYLFASRAAALPIPKTRLFVDVDVYTWKAADLVATCAFYLEPELFYQGKRAAHQAWFANPDDQRLEGNLERYRQCDTLKRP